MFFPNRTNVREINGTVFVDARTVTENPAYMQAQIKVPAGETYHAGQVVVAETLDNLKFSIKFNIAPCLFNSYK